MSSHELAAAPERLRAALRCPRCGARGLSGEGAGSPPAGPDGGRPWPDDGALRCPRGHTFAVWRGVPDFVGADGDAPTPFQRVMQAAPVAAIYERWWRPLGLWVASRLEIDEVIAEVVRLCAPAGRGLVLDVGCGPGNYTRALWRAGAATVAGVDLSPVMLERAVAEARGTGLCFVRASALELPFADRSVDAVCCAGALHLFEDPDRAMREMARVLAPGGVLVGQTVLRPRAPAARLAAGVLDRAIRFGFFENAALFEARLRAAGLDPTEGKTHGIAHVFRAVPR
jgi:SAM-dependent methyltransferase